MLTTAAVKLSDSKWWFICKFLSELSLNQDSKLIELFEQQKQLAETIKELEGLRKSTKKSLET